MNSNQPTLKPTQYILSSLITLICGFIILSYGWIAYSTITDRPGINGHWYLYLGLGKIQFFVYNLIAALSAFGFILAQAFFLIRKKTKRLTRTYWWFLLYFSLLILCESYLNLQFVPKA